MIQQKEHIHILQIKREGEQHLFQIKLPKNAKRIIGIQVSIQPITNNEKTTHGIDSPLFSLEQIIR